MIIDICDRVARNRAYHIDIVQALEDDIGPKRAMTLKSVGVKNLGDLSKMHHTEVACLYGFGTVALAKIDAVLTEHGLEPLDQDHVDVSSEIFSQLRCVMPATEAQDIFDDKFRT